MFEVSWQDPASETVAQHRERKDREEGKSNRRTRRSSLKSVDSNDFSKNQSNQRPSVFTPHKKGSLPNNNVAPLKQGAPTLAQKRLATSRANSTTEVLGSLTISTGGKSDDSSSHPRDGGDVKNGSSPASNADSVHSGWPGRSSTELTWDSMTDCTSRTYEIQPLAPNSFVCRSTEITISCQDSRAILDHPVKEVYITADAPLPDDLNVYPFPTVRTQKSTRDMPIISPRSKAPDLWKPPNDWDCSPEGSDREGKSQKTEPHGEAIAMTTDPTMAIMQADIHRMAAASPEIMLHRLREEWPVVADAGIYKQVEHEKTLWMLVALRGMISNSTQEGQDGRDLLRKPSVGPTKVLSLYESKAATSVLASFTDAEIHRLAASTVSPTSFHGIYPITVPSPSVHLPYAPNIFSSISAMTLPALLSSSSIPSLLRECHRALVPMGTLRLTIMDPSPVAATLGPRLRAWLDDHLLLNLERQFRCTNPGRLFPIWLRDVGFASAGLDGTSKAGEAAAKGASVSRISFCAVGQGKEANSGESKDADIGELEALVGRMLWKEIWGGFAEAKEWWWDDREILDECRSLGTLWDCAVFKAVKKHSG